MLRGILVNLVLLIALVPDLLVLNPLLQLYAIGEGFTSEKLGDFFNYLISHQ